jgi:hypothetical protein
LTSINERNDFTYRQWMLFVSEAGAGGASSYRIGDDGSLAPPDIYPHSSLLTF